MSFDNRSSAIEGNGANSDMQAASAVCKTGCGFYANASFDGMCSKCYKDKMTRQQLSSPRSSDTNSATTVTTSSSTSSLGSHTSATTSTADFDQTILSVDETQTSEAAISTSLDTGVPTITIATVKPDTDDRNSASGIGFAESSQCSEAKSVEKPKRSRCLTCRKKVGLTGFECRCGGLFCSVHRYSDTHGCSFDYKEHGQELIRRNNPVVAGTKIQKL